MPLPACSTCRWQCNAPPSAPIGGSCTSRLHVPAAPRPAVADVPKPSAQSDKARANLADRAGPACSSAYVTRSGRESPPPLDAAPSSVQPGLVRALTQQEQRCCLSLLCLDSRRWSPCSVFRPSLPKPQFRHRSRTYLREAAAQTQRFCVRWRANGHLRHWPPSKTGGKGGGSGDLSWLA